MENKTEEKMRDPVCGMTPNPEAARAKGNWLSYQGTDYIFCCGGCKAKFEATPEKYLKPPQPDAKQLVRDPVCGMTPNVDAAKTKGNFVHYEGVEYYFCSAGCKAKFEAEPGKYLSPLTRSLRGRPLPQGER